MIKEISNSAMQVFTRGQSSPIPGRKEMIKQLLDSVSCGSHRDQSNSVSRDTTECRHSRGNPKHHSLRPDCSQQRPESLVVPQVVLVEHRDEVFDQLKHCFMTAGFCVIRARNSSEVFKCYASEPANLLVINADVSAESAWLQAAKIRLQHPAARIWAYIRETSNRDVSAANLLAIEELIEYEGKVAQLESQILDRLGVSPPSPGNPDTEGVGFGNVIRSEPVTATVYTVS